MMTGAGVPILMYHALADRPSPITVSPAVFAGQMRWLHQHHYQVMALGRLVDLVHQNRPLPPRTVTLTFDDGFAGLYQHAFPLLAEFGFSATVFLVSDYCGQQNDWPGQAEAVPRLPLLNWAQIKEMDRHGIEFGGHTATHPRLDRLSPDRLAGEIIQAKDAIESRLGHAIDQFAYPYGRYNSAVKAMVAQVYRGACATHLDLVNPQSDPLALARVEALYVSPLPLFRQLFHPLFPTYLWSRRTLRQAAGRLLRREWV